MNQSTFTEWAKRQQVPAVILLGGAILYALWYFPLYQQRQTRAQKESDIKGMRNQLARKGLLLGEEALLKKKRDEEKYKRMLEQEWKDTAARLAAFDKQKDLATTHVDTIDFKVALIDVRQRLQKKSRATGIRLPYALGMNEAVNTNEDARKLMLQLRAVERLADLSLNLKITMLGQIEPLPPVIHNASNGQGYLEEYPVQMEFYGSLENAYDLFAAILEPQHVFFLKKLRIEAASQERPDLLRISTTLSTLLFYKDPNELKPVPATRSWHTGPGGF